MKTERETVAPGGAQKTKGKRSKLSQRRRDDETGVLPSLRVGGDGTHGTNGDDPNDTNLKGFFATGDPLGLDVGDGAQQGSPTLLSALKGSSLRAAYGAEFAGAFKEDTMSLLGDFKNAAARFSTHPLGPTGDGLSAEGDLQSDALWSSFPSDVDALFPSRVDMYAGAEMYGPSGRGGGGGALSGGHATNRAGSPESAADMFRQGNPGNAPSQFIFDGYGGAPQNANGGGGSNGAHPSMSLDSSYDTYMGAQFKQNANGSRGGNERGNGAGVRGMRVHASMAPGQPGSNPHADPRGEPRYYVGGGVVGGSQQTQQAHMNYVQMGGYAGGVPGSANDGGNDLTNPNGGGSRHSMGGANGGVMMPPGAGRGNAYRNGGGGNYGNQPMMRVPSSGSLGMMPPGNPQQSYGYGGEQGGPARGGGFEALEAQGKGERKQRAAGGKNARGKNAGAKRGADGGGAETMDGGAGAAGTWSYGGQGHPSMQHRMQQGGGMVYHQRNTGVSHRMMPQPQHASGAYSGSSSVSTTMSGNSAGLVRGVGNAHGPAGMMMMPPYYMNQSGIGPNDGSIHMYGRGVKNDMSAAEAGLVELEAIIGKLDKATSHNIKESLYRLARSSQARRGARGGGEGGSQHASGQAQQPSDKKQSMVDRCVANLLYHRYPDAPAEPPDAFQEGGVQSQQMDGAGDGGNGRAVAGVPSGMNVIRGRHGSA